MNIHGKVTAQRKKIANFAITLNHHTFKNTITKVSQVKIHKRDLT